MFTDFDPLVYKVASISKLFWKEYLSLFEDAQMMVRQGASKLFAFPSFTLEVFHRLYYESEPEKLDPAPPESAWAEKLHNEFQELIGFDDLVEQCQGNQLAAGLATEEYCTKVFEKLPPPIPRLDNPQQYRDMIGRLKQNPGLQPTQVFKELLNSKPTTPGTTPLPREKTGVKRSAVNKTTHPSGQITQHTADRFTTFHASPKTKQQQEMEQWLRDLIEESGDEEQVLTQLLQQEGKLAVQRAQGYAAQLEATQVRQILRAALVAAYEKLEESAQWLLMMGLSWGQEVTQDSQVSPKEKLLLARQIAGNAKLRQIAFLAGRFKDVADRKRRSKAKDAFGEITTIELGNNLSRLLPSELQKLSDPALFPLFASRYYDRSLLQYKTSGKQKHSRGPLVICLDSSGSMNGLPDDWAKAVTAVLGQIAYQEHRHFRVIHFATRVCRIDDFPPLQHDYQRLLESMLAFFNGGGTQWQPALQAAVECIEQQSTQFKQADIVMVTDGKCDVEWEFLEQLKVKKKQLEFSVYGVLIGNSKTTKLHKFCDRVWAVEDLASNEAAIEELFLV